jgi:hypothetical protein
MKLLIEKIEDAKTLITEENGNKNYYVSGVFMQAEVKNRNGRIYPAEILDREVRRYNTESISKNRSYGELNHPANPSINLDRVSHLIVELKRDGSNFVGKAKILDTPMGKIAKAIMDEGGQLGISSRGLGSLKESSDHKVVQSDFRLVTAGDIVSDPSAPDAWLENLREEAEWVMEAGHWVQKFRDDTLPIVEEIVRKTVNDRKAREKEYLKLFESYLTRISG